MARITPADYTAPHLSPVAYRMHGVIMRSWPTRVRYQCREPLGAAIRAWVMYAAGHRAEFEQEIGANYVAGPRWAEWGFALRGLLVIGNLAPLDCGSLDHVIAENLRAQGFNPDVEGERLPPSQAAKR